MRIRKAILTGGGRATRLYPITTTTNKHLLPLANKPMIFHAIEQVVGAGIEEIFINTNPGETELQKQVGDGSRWGVSVKFFEQTGGPLGIAHVVAEAQRFIGADPFMFYLSDNILLGGIAEMVDAFAAGVHDCMLALSQVKDPERFGVAVFDAEGQLIDVIEKPAAPPSSFAVTGIYLYGPNIFFEAFPQIQKSARGEYEISSIHSHLLKTGRRVGYKEITGWWKDTGKPEDLLLANELLLKHLPPESFPQIGAGTTIAPDVRFEGPVVIGKNCILESCTIGPYVSLGAGSVVRGGTITRSIILESASIHGDIAMSESILGKHVTIRKKASGAQQTGKFILGDKTVVEI